MHPEFDPNGPGTPGNYFGLPFTYDEARLVILPVPWDVTVSYHEGTSNGPEAIKEASLQVDLHLNTIRESWKLGLHGLELLSDLAEKNEWARPLSKEYLYWLENGPYEGGKEYQLKNLEQINQATHEMCTLVQEESLRQIESGKKVCCLGGDHSIPLGLIQALAEKEDFGILQIDAHADLREAYEGFEHSHASIMFNALKLKNIEKLVQVGIRDLCDEEAERIEADPRIHTFFYQDMQEKMDTGRTWQGLSTEIIDQLPEKVYISFDIDGLDPSLCPNTGTPVPGGLQFFQAVYLIKHLVHSGRKIIGFDLCEVSPGKDNDWDANVGARMLYYLATWMGVSQGWLAEK